MTRKTLCIFAGCLAIAALIGAGTARGASVFDIEYPIADLGGCADRSLCKQYCDDAGHADACLEFAQKYGLADKEAVEKTRVVQEEGGPGGCRGDACKTYCDDPGHQDECVDYAVQKGFMTFAEAERAKKPGPGGCRGVACRLYCEDTAHEDECFDYAVKNGIIPKEEAERISEFKEKFGKQKTGPGGCQGEDQCRQYCEDPEHITECVSFAEEHGFVDKEQAKIIKKTAGKGPGGCKGSNECRTYCDDQSHQQECIDFGEQNGFMSADEAARARKVVGKDGPGGCRGQQCRDFCDTPGNEDACLEFAEREGLIPKEEAARAKKFSAASKDGGPGGCRGVTCRNYCESPEHREECYAFAKEKGLISPEEQEHFDAGSKIEEVVRTAGGPGGCKSEQECRAYCGDPSRVEECVAFGATHGGVPPEQARRMLKQFAEQRFEARGGPGEFGSGGFEGFRRSEEDAGRRFEEFRALEEQFRGKEFPGFGEHGGFPGGPPEGFPGPGDFPGVPGEFPGGEGGPSFAGPGGCASPAECIKYCTEHKEECFGGGSGPSDHGAQEQRGSFEQNAFSRGGERGQDSGQPIRLRSNLMREFKQNDLPPGFEQKSPEERQQFFRERIQQERGFSGGEQNGFPPSDGPFPDGASDRFPHQQGEFPREGSGPGQPSGGSPGNTGEFPGRPDSFPGRPPQGGFPGGFPRDDSGAFPPRPDGMTRPEGGSLPPPPPQGDSGEFFHPPQESAFMPPPGDHSFSQPVGSFPPPPPSGSDSGSFTPPPPSSSGESFSSPPPSGDGVAPPPPPPSTAAPFLRFFGSLLGIFQ